MPRDYKKKHPEKSLGRPLQWTEERAIKVAEDLLAWMQEPGNVYFKQFTLSHGIYSDVIADMSSKYPAFASAIKRAKEMQELKLATLLLDKQNPAGAIFALKNNGHNWTDKRETKSENINHNYGPKDLETKTESELQDMLLNLTAKPGKVQSD